MSQRTVVTLSISLFVLGLLWGGYTLIVYLGIPLHELVYSTQDAVHTIDVACGNDASIGTYLCRGSMVVFPTVVALFKMSSPFFAYILLSLALYAALLLWQGYKTGEFQLDLKLRPISLIIGFAFAVWLLGATLSMGSLYNWSTPEGQLVAGTSGGKVLPPFNRFYEPIAQVYTGVGPQGLAALKANYDSLLSRGCLTQIGSTQNGARIYNLHFLCMQESFFARVGLQFVMVLLFLLNLLVLGRLLLVRALRAGSVHPLLQLCFSFGLGALGWVAILWTLGVFGQLHGTLLRILFFGLPLVLLSQTQWWAKAAWAKTIDYRASWKSLFPILVWLLISYLALNFLNVVRPFPIGWDDLGSYLNRPRLLASYGAFIPSMSQFQWEYLTSLGFLLFGYDSWHGASFAMEINWSAGLLAVLIVYSFGRLYLGRGRGVLSAILYYFLPMVGHFSFADMKIDNAVFFASTAALLAAFVALLPTSEENAPPPKLSRSILLIAGLFAGFAFGIKPTAVLSMLMIFSILAGFFLGPLGFTGMSIAGFGILAKFGPLSLKDIATRSLLPIALGQSTFCILAFILAFVFLAAARYRHRSALLPALASLGFFIAGVFVAMIPWMVHNVLIALPQGNVSLTGTPLAAQDLLTPQVFYQQKSEVDAMHLAPSVPVRMLPPELKLDPHHSACQTSARTEELDRYWGFSQGLSHYLTLPWRQVMNIDAFGYYVTLVPALLLFPLVLLLPFFWSRERRWIRLLFAGTAVFFVQWALVGSGIPWYGVGMFLGFAVLLEAFIAYAPDTPNRSIYGVLIAASIIVCLLNRFWQFDSQKNIFEYPLGKISAEALREITIPDYDDIRNSVVSRHETMKETPFTYRIGTFISYFIPQNREILPLADHQLNFFNCLNQENDHALTLRRLKALGFNSFIFDTNTQTIEKDPNGSLHQKVNTFLAFINDPVLNLNIVVNDPGNGIAYILIP